MEATIRFLARFNNLKAVFLFQVALPVFLLLGILFAITLNLVGELAEERLERDLRQVARAIRLPVASALEENNREQMYASLASVFEISEVYGAYLFDINGDRLQSFGSVNPSRRQADRALEITAEGEQEFDLYEEISGRNVYSFFQPLYDTGGQPNGLLQVTRRRSDIEQELGQLNRWIWGGFSIAFLVSLGCLVVAHQRGIGKPFDQLVGSMRTVQRGERGHRAKLRGPKEVRQIASSLNQMLDAIESAEEKVRQEHHEKEKVSEQLRRAEKMAAIGQIAAGVAHELGAPLSVISGRAQRLLRRINAGGASGDTAGKEVKTIREQVDRMSVLVQQLLSYGRSSSAPHKLHGMEEIFERALEIDEESKGRATLRKGPPVDVHADLFSLEQGLTNLLRNARQASPDGTVRAGWEVGTGEEAGKVVMFVEDDGPGIDDTLRDSVFEPFVTTKIPGEGSGMGLAIVQRVAQDHGGSVRVVDSELGGARFELILPAAERGE